MNALKLAVSRAVHGERAPVTPASATLSFSQADLDCARNEGRAAGEAAGQETGHAAGYAAGAAAERARIEGIIRSEEGKARPEIAERIAFKTTMSVDAAKSYLTNEAASSRIDSSAIYASRAAQSPSGAEPASAGGSAPAARCAPARVDAAAIYAGRAAQAHGH